ncbi:MAG: hypothetical protein ABR569_01165 [Gaiellaceae bacterium]
MSLGSHELAEIATVAAAQAEEGETLTGVVAAEPVSGGRVYLCSFEGDHRRSWLALDETGQPLLSRSLVREAVSIAGMCELAEETAGGGDLEALRGQLLTLRLTEAPEGIEEAEEAALAVEQAIGAPPRLASSAYLDRLGSAVRRLEQALGPTGNSPFAAAMQQAVAAIEELAADVEANYKGGLR